MSECGRPDIWESRYRDLERTIEHMLIQVAEAMEQNEAFHAEGGDANVPLIRQFQMDSEADRRAVICVADGRNLSYRYEIYDGDRLIHASSTVRRNSYEVPSGTVGSRVRVVVTEQDSGRAVESQCGLEVAQ